MLFTNKNILFTNNSILLKRAFSFLWNWGTESQSDLSEVQGITTQIGFPQKWGRRLSWGVLGPGLLGPMNQHSLAHEGLECPSWGWLGIWSTPWNSGIGPGLLLLGCYMWIRESLMKPFQIMCGPCSTSLVFLLHLCVTHRMTCGVIGEKGVGSGGDTK